MANIYTDIPDVAFGDTWSAASHNDLMANAEAGFMSASCIHLYPAMGFIAAANAPAETTYTSTDAGTWKPIYKQIGYDDSTAEGAMWQFYLPYTVTTPVLKVGYSMAGANTSKSVKFDAYLACLSDGDSVFGKAFATANSSTVTCPDAAGVLDMFTITLTNANSIAEGDLVTLILVRDTTVVNDATGDVNVHSVTFCYQ